MACVLVEYFVNNEHKGGLVQWESYGDVKSKYSESLGVFKQ